MHNFYSKQNIRKMTNKRKRITVGSLNCRSLNKHKKKDLVDDMIRHNLIAIATQETKIRGKTSEFITARDKKNRYIHYNSGVAGN